MTSDTQLVQLYDLQIYDLDSHRGPRSGPPAPKKPTAPCVDDLKWHEIGNDVHNCKWAGEDPFYRCGDKPNVDGLKAWEVCKDSCGLCDIKPPCKDDKEWFAKGDPTKDCQWVLQTMAIDATTCDRICSAGSKPK